MKREFRFILLLYTGSYIILFLYSLYSFPSGELLHNYFGDYLFINPALLMIENFLLIFITGFLISHSLFNSIEEKGVRSIESLFIPLIVTALVYIVLSEGVYPVLKHKLVQRKYTSELAQDYYRRGTTAFENDNFQDAIDIFDLYLLIDNTHVEASELREEAERRLNNRREFDQSTEANTPIDTSSLSKADAEEVENLIDKAQYYFSRGDYFSAHYFATTAFRFDGSRDDASQIAVRSWEKITSYPIGNEDIDAAELYRKKKTAYTFFINGETIDAYYIFKELEREFPSDRDVKVYVEESRKAVLKMSFFIDEMENQVPLWEKHRIVFVNHREEEETEIVALRKMVKASNGIYFYGIEVIRLLSTGGISVHLKAPYGKLIGDYINMNCIHRKNPGISCDVEYLRGKRPDEIKHIVKLQPTVTELGDLALDIAESDVHELDKYSVYELLRLKRSLGMYGFPQDKVGIVILVKLVRFFAVLVGGVLCLFLGTHLRARYHGKLPLAFYLVVPLFLVPVSLILKLYFYFHRLLFGLTVISLGFNASLVLLFPLQLALFALVSSLFISLASSKLKTTPLQVS